MSAVKSVQELQWYMIYIINNMMIYIYNYSDNYNDATNGDSNISKIAIRKK